MRQRNTPPAMRLVARKNKRARRPLNSLCLSGDSPLPGEWRLSEYQLQGGQMLSRRDALALEHRLAWQILSEAEAADKSAPPCSVHVEGEEQARRVLFKAVLAHLSLTRSLAQRQQPRVIWAAGEAGGRFVLELRFTTRERSGEMSRPIDDRLIAPSLSAAKDDKRRRCRLLEEGIIPSLASHHSTHCSLSLPLRTPTE